MRTKAVPIVAAREMLADGVFFEAVIWRVPAPVRGCKHHFKYRLALVADDVCVLRYDNEAGKGDHKHVGRLEQQYEFKDIQRLQRDFLLDTRRWLDENRRD